MQSETKCFFDLLGWQGGTVHDAGKALGVDGLDLIHGTPDQHARENNDYTIPSDYILGQYAHDTCGIEFARSRLIPKYKGNLNFWLGFKRAAYLASLNKVAA